MKVSHAKLQKKQNKACTIIETSQWKSFKDQLQILTSHNFQPQLGCSKYLHEIGY